jgi:hypothetical protein
VGDAEDLLAELAEIDVALAEDAVEPAAKDTADLFSAMRADGDLGLGLDAFDHGRSSYQLVGGDYLGIRKHGKTVHNAISINSLSNILINFNFFIDIFNNITYINSDF